jgi:hypothetical protein
MVVGAVCELAFYKSAVFIVSPLIHYQGGAFLEIPLRYSLRWFRRESERATCSPQRTTTDEPSEGPVDGPGLCCPGSTAVADSDSDNHN